MSPKTTPSAESSRTPLRERRSLSTDLHCGKECGASGVFARPSRYLGSSNDRTPQEKPRREHRLADGERRADMVDPIARNSKREPEKERKQNRGEAPERHEEVGDDRRKDVDGNPRAVGETEPFCDRADRIRGSCERRNVADPGDDFNRFDCP